MSASTDARCSLLPPREHAFWRDPDAVEHAIAATLCVEQARLDAVAAAEEARQQTADAHAALARCQAEVVELRKQLAAARKAAGPDPRAAEALASAHATAQAALAEAATLRAALEVERTRARDAARAAAATTGAAAAAASAGAARPQGMDALRCELLEERMRVRELQQQLWLVTSGEKHPPHA